VTIPADQDSSATSRVISPTPPCALEIGQVPRAKTGILVAAAAGVVCGAAVALVNFGWDLGQQI
jgi:hypothetical protein